jgi:hypothetical protein
MQKINLTTYWTLIGKIKTVREDLVKVKTSLCKYHGRIRHKVSFWLKRAFAKVKNILAFLGVPAGIFLTVLHFVKANTTATGIALWLKVLKAIGFGIGVTTGIGILCAVGIACYLLSETVNWGSPDKTVMICDVENMINCIDQGIEKTEICLLDIQAKGTFLTPSSYYLATFFGLMHEESDKLIIQHDWDNYTEIGNSLIELKTLANVCCKELVGHLGYAMFGGVFFVKDIVDYQENVLHIQTKEVEVHKTLTKLGVSLFA